MKTSRRFALILYVVLVLLCAPGAPARPFRAGAQDAPRPELRAFWADGFNEGYRTPQQIDTLLQRLHDAHCNAVFAQMRKGGDAFYASHYEPWATEDAAHFDALACLIERAHHMQPPIAVHAWINTCAVGTGAKHTGYHIARLHPEWLALNARGQADDGEVRKIDPGNPDAIDWTFRLYLDVVRHYDVDGIHFDFVRYGGRNFGYNPVSVRRFLNSLPPGYKMKPYTPRQPQPLADAFAQAGVTALPASDDPAWKQWRREQVTNFVRKVYAHAVQIKPRVVVSAATIAWGDGPRSDADWLTRSAAMNRVFQDWRGWLNEGILDLACPMTYFAGRHGPDYERTWQAWIVAHQYGRAGAVAVGNWQLTPVQTLAQMAIARQADAQGRRAYGVMLYSYAGTNRGAKAGQPGLHELELQPAFYALLGQPSPGAPVPPFASDAPRPPMPWKEHPTRGIIKGFVRDGLLRPLDGAAIALETTHAGHRQRTIRRADATGFYAFVDLPPGTYQVRLLPGAASAEQGRRAANLDARQVQVTAGNVTNGAIRLQTADAADVEGITACEDLQAVARLASASAATSSSVTGLPAAGSSAFNSSTTPAQARNRARVDDVTVVLGTDTYPGNLYVQDKSGACLRVRLATPPLVPFQPGDVIAVLGTPAGVEGEPALDNAVACLNDISLVFDPPLTAPAPLQNAALLPALPARFARARGAVVGSDANGFTLAVSAKAGEPSFRVTVPLAGRKDFGVESQSLLAAPPALNAIVEVTGLAQTLPAPQNGARSVRLLPRTAADIVTISPPPAALRSSSPRVVPLVVFIALVGAGLWYAVRRARRKPSFSSS